MRLQYPRWLRHRGSSVSCGWATAKHTLVQAQGVRATVTSHIFAADLKLRWAIRKQSNWRHDTTTLISRMIFPASSGTVLCSHIATMCLTTCRPRHIRHITEAASNRPPRRCWIELVFENDPAHDTVQHLARPSVKARSDHNLHFESRRTTSATRWSGYQTTSPRASSNDLVWQHRSRDG